MNIFNFRNTERALLRETVLLLFLVCGFLILVDQLSIHWGLGIWQRITDDLTGGIIAASIFYLYERRAKRRFREHLRLIDLMNHHIRNALQPLMFVPCQPEAAVQKQLVEECVEHIDWALREILPGKSKERFVVPAANFTGSGFKIAPSPIESSPRSSGNSENSRYEPENHQPQTFFAQWFDTWIKRNRTAPSKRVAGGFPDRVSSSPWKNYRAAVRQHKGGSDA
jgi:hypothetical protein